MPDSKNIKIENKQQDGLFVDLIVSLTILEKNISMYPNGHTAILRSSERLFSQMDDLFLVTPQLTFGAVKNLIYVDERPLETTNVRVQDFALFLSQRGVAWISFRKGIHAQELERFYRLFMEVPPKSYIHHHPDIQAKISQLSYIRIKEIDLSGIQFIEYGSDQEPRAARGPGGAVASGSRSQGLSEPSLGRQILSTTLEDLNSATDEHALEEILASIPSDMVVAALQQAKETNGEISPSLLNLLGALSRKWKPSLEQSPSGEQQLDITLNQIQTLFKRELYETYVSDAYDEDLHRVSMGERRQSQNEASDFSFERCLGAMDDEHIDKTIARALLRLTAGALEDEVYCDFAKNMSQLVMGLLESYNYSLLVDIYNRFSEDAQNKEGKQARDAAAEVLCTFSLNRFTLKLAEIYSNRTASYLPEVESLILLTGPRNLTWLLSLYAQHCNGIRGAEIGDLICRFGEPATEAALGKLSEGDGAQILGLMRLIQKCGNSYSPLQLRGLLESQQAEVRMEAFKMLLVSKDQAAMTALQKLLHAKDEDVFLQGARLVQAYGIRELSQELAGMIRTGYISEKAFARNKRIIAILEGIGSPEVLPMLQSISQVKLSWSPGNLRHTQEALYKSLSGYPGEAIQELLQQGLKSKNIVIRNLCKKMILMN